MYLNVETGKSHEWKCFLLYKRVIFSCHLDHALPLIKTPASPLVGQTTPNPNTTEVTSSKHHVEYVATFS